VRGVHVSHGERWAHNVVVVVGTLGLLLGIAGRQQRNTVLKSLGGYTAGCPRHRQELPHKQGDKKNEKEKEQVTHDVLNRYLLFL
jgi:hypothetical protein